MSRKEHWESVYSSKATDEVSWFQGRAERSMQFIEASGVPRDAAIIDVGGGASVLVDELLARRYTDITVLDLSAAALDAARQRMGKLATRVSWLEADITEASLEPEAFDLWHDRAVFHFLVSSEDRLKYVRNMRKAVKPGGHVIIATFAEDGPLKCSGLPVMRYSSTELASELGDGFTLIDDEKETHETPFGTTQRFTWCWFRRD